MAKPGIALQLYTVRDELARDFVGTVRKVAAMGYPAVQLAGYGGLQANALNSLLGDLGLIVAGNHIGLDRLEHHLDEEIEINRTIGNRDLICPGLYPEARREGGAATYRRYGDLFAKLAERCRKEEMRFSYHNHAFEFVKQDGEWAIDLLLAAKGVLFEPDVYWIAVGGEDPAPWIRKYAGRIPYIHIKDLDPKRDPTYAEIGRGNIDFKPIFEASEAGGAEWYVVEQDACPGPSLESAKISLETLRSWGKL